MCALAVGAAMLTSASLGATAAARSLPTIAIEAPSGVGEHDKRTARMVLRARRGGYRGVIGIEKRGQSSREFPKRSYAIETRKRDGDNRDAGLLGMPADDDWVLYASWNDKTLLRNVLAFQIARLFGRYAPRTRFVHLKLNGRYKGVYVLMESLKLHKRRIDVPDQGLSGAYLVEWTFNFQADRKGGAGFRGPLSGRPFIFTDPDRDELASEEREYMSAYVAEVERRLWAEDGTWREVLDEPAAVDFVLMHEIFKDSDVFHGSTYMTKPSDAPLRLGPIWDLDIAFSNVRNPDAHPHSGWWVQGRGWAEWLWRDAAFRNALVDRWTELSRNGLGDRILARLAAAQRAVRPGVRRNFRRWPILDDLVWNNPAARKAWPAEVAFLRHWIRHRVAWIDANIQHLRS